MTATCYSLDGRQGSSDIQACNLNATGVGGSHSACCKVQNQDACLSTGLCLNTLARQSSHFLWATGCTDPTFVDSSCPKYCRTTGWGNARLQNCNDTHYCCAQWDMDRDQAACCNSSFPLDGPIGTITRQIHSTDSNLPETPSNATSSDNNNTIAKCTNANIPTRATVGLSVEGVALLIALVALGYIFWSRKRLKKEMDTLKRAVAAGECGHPDQAKLHQPIQISELAVNPHELPAVSEPSQLYGDIDASENTGWHRPGLR